MYMLYAEMTDVTLAKACVSGLFLVAVHGKNNCPWCMWDTSLSALSVGGERQMFFTFQQGKFPQVTLINNRPKPFEVTQWLPSASTHCLSNTELRISTSYNCALTMDNHLFLLFEIPSQFI